MKTPQRWRWTAGAVTLMMAASPAVVASAAPGLESHGEGRSSSWAGSWAAAVAHGNQAGSTDVDFTDQSVRLIVHTSVGGRGLRVRLTNIYGEQAVRVGHATVAKPD